MIRKIHFIFTLLLLAVCGHSQAVEIYYEVTFANNSKDVEPLKTTTLNTTFIIDNFDKFESKPCSNIKAAYYGMLDNVIRLGQDNSTGDGKITFALSPTGQVKATKIVVNAQSRNKSTLKCNGIQSSEFKTVPVDLTYNLDGNTLLSKITLETNYYTLINSIRVFYESDEEPSLVSIGVAEGNVKKNYLEGSTFDCTGMSLYGTYNDNSRKVITENIVWEVDPTPLALGTTSAKVKATINGVASIPYTVNGIKVYSRGTAEAPITVAQANQLSSLFNNVENVFVKGIVVSNSGTINEGAISFNISDDGTATNQLNVSDCKSFLRSDFTSLDDVAAGKTVTVNGLLINSEDNYLINGILVNPDLTNEINDQDDVYTPIEGVQNILLKRTFDSSGWNTLVLPFAASEEQLKEVFGENVKLAVLLGTTNDGNDHYTLNFNYTTTIQANSPVLITGISNSGPFEFKNVNVVAPTSISGIPFQVAGHQVNDFAIGGTYKKVTIPAYAAQAKQIWYIASDNKFYQVKGGETFKITRCCFILNNTSTSAKGMTIMLDNEEITSVDGIQLNAKANNAPLYNIAGQKVDNSYKGIVIQNGKKISR